MVVLVQRDYVGLELLKLVEYLVLNVIEIQGPLTVRVLRDLQNHCLGGELYVDLDKGDGLRTGLVVSIWPDTHVEVVDAALRSLQWTTHACTWTLICILLLQ